MSGCISKFKNLKKQFKVAYENNEKKMESVYSKRIKAGKRRTYFFDVRETRGADYYLTITESRKRFDSDGYDRHKIFLYKEDFNKFIKGLNEAVDFVKTDLMPDFDFDAFNHDTPYEEGAEGQQNSPALPMEATPAEGHEESPTNSSAPETPLAGAQELPKEEPGAGSGIQHEEVDKW